MSPKRPATAQVIALVAARDEADRIVATVKGLYQIPSVSEVVVADDASTDATAALANGAGARVLVTQKPLGKGGALDGLIERTQADVYLLVDGDVGDSAPAAAALLVPVLEGRADLTVGILPHGPGGGLGTVKRLSRWLIRRLGGFDAEEPMSGQRAATRGALEACRPFAPGFGVETAMTIDAARLGLRIVEVDVAMTHRPTGRTVRGFVHRGGQGFDILRAAAGRALRAR